MTLNVRADIPEENFATSVVVVVPVIRATNGVRYDHCESVTCVQY